MAKMIPSENIYAAPSRVAAEERGVFARKDIQQGKMIETCPVIHISKDDTAEIHEESLVSYMFYCGEKKEKSLIALGFGSLYNHTQTPNATYKINPEENCVVFLAIKDIAEDEEITVSYAQGNKEKLWFEK